jgi:hypothetical protein
VPGTTLPQGAVYKTVDLSSLLPAAVVNQIPGQYADLEFSYGLSSSIDAAVSIAGTDASPVIDYTDAAGAPSTLTVAKVVADGVNGFRFTDPSGQLWTVLDQPVSGATPADPLLLQAIAMESANPILQIELENLKKQIDAMTGGNPIVYPTNPLNGAPCFAAGTKIATPMGDVAVEALTAGDVVLLATGGAAPVRWVGHRRVRLSRHPAPASAAPVRIEAGALGGGVPVRTLRVSPDHALFLDGALVPAGLLVNGETITQETVSEVDYVHVELDRHAILLAEGAAAESYLDTGNRAMFSNARIVSLTPDMAVRDGGTPCAEMVLGGDRLDAIRAALPRADAVRLAS